MRLLKRLMVPVLAFEIGNSIVGCSKDYSRNIGDVKVEYREYEPPLYSYGNGMKVVKGDTTFEFSDLNRATRLDWGFSHPLTQDDLSRVRVFVGDKYKEYSVSDTTKDGLVGEVTKAAFERFNPWYNELRTALRDSLRKDYIEGYLGFQK